MGIYNCYETIKIFQFRNNWRKHENKNMLTAGTLEGTRRLIDMFVDKIVVNEDTIVVKYNPSAFILNDAEPQSKK